VDILTEALQKYKGSLIMVSHDRQFIEAVANKIWFIDNKKIKEYPGSYSEYEYWESSSNQVKKQEPSKPEKDFKKNIKSRSFEEQKRLKNKLNSLHNKLENLEEEISTLEARKEKVEKQMLDPDVYTNYEKLASMTSDFEKLELSINKKHIVWEKMINEIEKLEETVG
jgi:ATP-binding cassette subfamily F protein 3